MRVFIFAHRNDKTGGGCPGTSTSNGPEPARSTVASVEVRPIGRRPVITGIAAKDRARLKANHCLAAAPGGRLKLLPVATNAFVPSLATPLTPHIPPPDGAVGPCRHASRIIYRHSHQPAMINVAIRHAPISNIKNVAHDGERRVLHLVRWNEGRAVVLSCQLHVHRPAGIDGARVHVKRNDVMFEGRSAIGRRSLRPKRAPVKQDRQQECR